MCGKHIAGSSPLLISSIYFKAGPAGILIVCSRVQKGTRKFLELFKMLGVPEIQCTGKRIVANVLVAALGDAVLVLVEDRQETEFVQNGLLQLCTLLLQCFRRTALVQGVDRRIDRAVGIIELVGAGVKLIQYTGGAVITGGDAVDCNGIGLVGEPFPVVRLGNFFNADVKTENLLPCLNDVVEIFAVHQSRADQDLGGIQRFLADLLHALLKQGKGSVGIIGSLCLRIAVAVCSAVPVDCWRDQSVCRQQITVGVLANVGTVNAHGKGLANLVVGKSNIVWVKDQSQRSGTAGGDGIVAALHVLCLINRADKQVCCAVGKICGTFIAAFPNLECQIGGVHPPCFGVDRIATHEDLVLVAVGVVEPQAEIECPAGGNRILVQSVSALGLLEKGFVARHGGSGGEIAEKFRVRTGQGKLQHGTADSTDTDLLRCQLSALHRVGILQTGEHAGIGGLCLRIKDSLERIDVVVSSDLPLFVVVHDIVRIGIIEPEAVAFQRESVRQSVRRNGVVFRCRQLRGAVFVQLHQPLVEVFDNGFRSGIGGRLGVQTFGIGSKAGGKQIAGAVAFFLFQKWYGTAGAKRQGADCHEKNAETA